MTAAAVNAGSATNGAILEINKVVEAQGEQNFTIIYSGQIRLRMPMCCVYMQCVL